MISVLLNHVSTCVLHMCLHRWKSWHIGHIGVLAHLRYRRVDDCYGQQDHDVYQKLYCSEDTRISLNWSWILFHSGGLGGPSAGQKIADIHYTGMVLFLCAGSYALSEYCHEQMICCIYHIYRAFHQCECVGEFFADCLAENLYFTNHNDWHNGKWLIRINLIPFPQTSQVNCLDSLCICMCIRSPVLSVTTKPHFPHSYFLFFLI